MDDNNRKSSDLVTELESKILELRGQVYGSQRQYLLTRSILRDKETQFAAMKNKLCSCCKH